MAKSKIVNVQGREIAIITQQQDDFISLTDIAKCKNQKQLDWLSLTGSAQNIPLHLWEEMHNTVLM